jgi:hypothetical protein
MEASRTFLKENPEMAGRIKKALFDSMSGSENSTAAGQQD